MVSLMRFSSLLIFFALQIALQIATLFAPEDKTEFRLFLFIPPIAKKGILIFLLTVLIKPKPTLFIPGFVEVGNIGPMPI
jgi:hypothetical protein